MCLQNQVKLDLRALEWDTLLNGGLKVSLARHSLGIRLTQFGSINAVGPSLVDRYET